MSEEPKYFYSESSAKKLETCHKDLQLLMAEVLRHFDHTILYGHRTPEKQFELYKQGRKFENGIWILEDKNKVVTNVDGINKFSEHNNYPSTAVDATPYPIDWKDKRRLYFFAGFVKATAIQLGINVRLGADWNMNNNFNDQILHDLPHVELYDKS